LRLTWKRRTSQHDCAPCIACGRRMLCKRLLRSKRMRRAWSQTIRSSRESQSWRRRSSISSS